MTFGFSCGSDGDNSSGGGADDDGNDGAVGAGLSGRWALPGDLLYLAHPGEPGGGLPRGHYWLAAQPSEHEVVLLRARRKGRGGNSGGSGGGTWGFEGEPFAAPKDVLGAMWTTGVRDGGADGEGAADRGRGEGGQI